MANRTTETTKIQGGAEYARVPVRLKMFREDRANGKIETDRTLNEDGSYEFTAWVWKDKTEYLEVLKAIGSAKEARGSADSIGHSKGMIKGAKDYEKLETVAIGRALAILGYLVSGEVASFEEMELFEADKKAEREVYIQDQISLIETATTTEELKEIWAQTDKTIPEILEAKDLQKEKIS